MQMERRTWTVKYAKEKAILLFMLLEIVVGIALFGFFVGRMYAINHTKVYYHAGIVTFSLDGHEYHYPAEGWFE